MTRAHQRLWAIGGIVAAFAILALGWFALISPMLDERRAVLDELDGVELQNQALQRNIDYLAEQNERMPELRAQLELARLELPLEVELESFAASLQTVGERNLVNLTSLSASAPTAIGGEEGSDTTYEVPVTFTVEGPATGVDGFVSDLQAPTQRALLITSVTLQPVGGISGQSIADTVVATYSGTVYVNPSEPLVLSEQAETDDDSAETAE